MKKTLKDCFDIQAQGPQKHEAPGICLVCQMVNPALPTGHRILDFAHLVTIYSTIVAM